MGYWRKTENEKGFLFYVNEYLNAQQWDHPKFSDLRQAIDDCNYVVYSSYRLAAKIYILQKCLYMQKVPLSIVTAVFENYKLTNNENSSLLKPYDLEFILSDIFSAANERNCTSMNVDLATELFINFLCNVFDSSREGKIQVFAMKLLLGILCDCSVEDLHKYLFSLCMDHNCCITPIRLRGLFHKMFIIIKYLHEDSYFGLRSVNSAVEQCFRDCLGWLGITEGDFLNFFASDIPFLSWMPLILKFRSAEALIHSTKCATCKSKPIFGLKYLCTSCSKYTQCQRCFLTARISNSHKLSHSLREYSTDSSSKSLLSKICGLFCPMIAEKKYSIVKPGKQFANEHIKLYQPTDPLSYIEPLSSPEGQLQGVIRQLEAQNRNLQQILIYGNYSDKEVRTYLEEYRLFMAGNIQKLKILKNKIDVKSSPKPIKLPQSNFIQPDDQRARFECMRLANHVSLSTMKIDLEDVESQCSSLSKNSVWNKSYVEDCQASPVETQQDNFDKALSILQHMLANNFYLNDSVVSMDDSILKYDVAEVPAMDQQQTIMQLQNDNFGKALTTLQEILANNYFLDDSVNSINDTKQACATPEVGGIYSSVGHDVEFSRWNSALSGSIRC